MKRRLTIIVGLLLLVTLLATVACSSRQSGVSPGKVFPVPTPTPTPAPLPPSFSVSDRGGIGFSGLPGVTEERKIVRNGDMSLIVRSVVDARDEIVRLAQSLNGFVVSSFISGEEQNMRGSITIRVPDDKFEPALSELRKLAVRVESESTNSRDVTEEFIDLQARLKNAEATEKQYLELLKQANVEETLKIYENLSRVRQEIEQIKGQLTFLERTTSMSLISIQLRPLGTGSGLVPRGWSALEALKSAIRGLVTLGQGLVTVLIWVMLFIPIWGTILVIIVRRIRRRPKAQT